ncbi:hypothetical protein [Arcicella rosea]|uniref:Uncharacterized protein n=1 Tax=Arcicella rosea TaxID=502909 RepID=A0A841EG72_9BACT|nr:hypothetical protein [Arcicella rosea]MBB6002332.1 hypothetical protein [Arcicella rosea]
MRQLLPILKPTGYRQEVPLFFKEFLFESSSSPVIAFGTDEGNRISYEGASDEEDYKNRFPILKRQAFDNLKEIQPSIEVQDAQGTKIAFVVGHEYASEKILDSDFMKQVGQLIGSKSLMVGIPFKGHLIATDSNSEIRLKFPAIIQKYYNNPQQDPISDKVFLVNDGEIVAMAGENLEDDGGKDNFIITENGKTNNYKVELKSKSIEELTENVNTSFQQVMAMIMQRKVFGGEVSYHLGGEMKLDKILTDKCQSYVTQIDENEMAQTLIQALTNSKTSLKFYYKNRQIAPLDNNSTPQQGFEEIDPEKKWWQFWK